jgi:hypothetical protein
MINRKLTCDEYQRAVELLGELGLYSGWTQELGGSEDFAGENIVKPNL